jgi:hypothetical protein
LLFPYAQPLGDLLVVEWLEQYADHAVDRPGSVGYRHSGRHQDHLRPAQIGLAL